MNILVTGASGYIGSLLSQKILDSGHNLKFFDLYPSNNMDINTITNHSRCTTYYGDIRDKVIVNDAIKNSDIIVHLAGISDGRMGKQDPELTKEINVKATKYLIEKAKNTNVKRFLFASTFGVYGNKYSEPLKENLKLNPIDPYSESKVICEEMLTKTTSASFVTCSLRIAMVYGLSTVTKFDLLVNQLIKLAIEKGELNIVGGWQKRPQIHVQDITDYFLKLISINSSLISGKKFNVISENPSINELTQIISSFLPKTKINTLLERKNENSFEMDGTKIKNELGLYPKYEITQGINELINYLINTKTIKV